MIARRLMTFSISLPSLYQSGLTCGLTDEIAIDGRTLFRRKCVMEQMSLQVINLICILSFLGDGCGNQCGDHVDDFVLRHDVVNRSINLMHCSVSE